MDDHSHGTHCSGTIGGVGNNGEGVAGVNWNVKIMALKASTAEGSLPSSAIIGAIEYATLMGARVSNNSYGGYGFSQAEYDAVKAAGEAGMVFVAAAGNETNDNDAMPAYPASFDLDCVIAVAATDHNDDIASFSNWGATTVDLGAPGVDIWSTIPTSMGSYGNMSGTSMATPHVTGASALILAADPTLTASKVKSLLLEYADPIDALAGKRASTSAPSYRSSSTPVAATSRHFPARAPLAPTTASTMPAKRSTTSPFCSTPSAGSTSAPRSWRT